MKNEYLERIVEDLSLIKPLFDRDVYLTVLDTEGVVQGFSLPNGVAPALQVGELFRDPSGAFEEVMQTGKVKHNRLPKDALGESFEGVLVPIKDGNRIVGCITCTYSIDTQEEIMEIAVKFQESMRDIENSIQAVIAGTNNLAEMLSNVSGITTNIEGDVQAASDVVGKISGNASRSNMLALNASIEAARSGEYGRGFTVVAEQMSKLAKDSGSSATEIKSTLDAITEHLISIVASMKDANEIANAHLSNISEIQSVLENTIMLAEKLERHAKQ